MKTSSTMETKPSYPLSIFSVMEPVQPQTTAPKSRPKVYTVVLIVTVFVLAVAATVLSVVLFQHSASTPTQVFHVTIENELRPIPVEFALDSAAKVEFVVVPALEEENNNTTTDGAIYILRDYNKGMSALKDALSNTCYIGKLGAKFEERTRLLTGTEDLQLRFNGTRRFVALNDTINPVVLSFTAGERIAAFCHPLSARWILEEPGVGGETSRRDKRFFWWWWGGWGCCRCYPSCYGSCSRSCVYGC